LFNLLNNRIDFEGIDVLDLFAGTGGIGIECVSRGAREVTAVEIAHVQQNWIISCCRQLGIKNLSVIRGDVFKFLSACRTKYDLIFADPPYALEGLELLPDKVLSAGILHPECYFILEHGDEHSFKNHPSFVKERRYGRVHFSFFIPRLP
jgi:16S rRNA (guanine(966)-N(2))-methyltransferase RsmD